MKTNLIRPEILPAQQAGMKTDHAIVNHNTQFCKAGNDIFFHLSGHSGLLGTGVTGGMGVRVCRKATVQSGDLARPSPALMA